MSIMCGMELPYITTEEEAMPGKDIGCLEIEEETVGDWPAIFAGVEKLPLNITQPR
jgi:hypothetical protein